MNFTSLLIRAIKSIPDSYHISGIVSNLDDDGNFIGDERYIPWCRKTLEEIAEFGQAHVELHHELSLKIDEGCCEAEIHEQLEELRKLDEKVGLCAYTQLISLIEFLEWKLSE